MEGNAEQTQQTPTIPNDASTSTPTAFSIGAFDGRERLARIHQEISDFLHYQSHVRLFAATSLPPTVPHPDDESKERIIKLLKEENRRLKVLHKLLNSLEANNEELVQTYTDTPTDWNAGGWNQDE